MEIVAAVVKMCCIMRYNIFNKGGFKRMDYKKKIIELVNKVENEEYLKYIYILLKTFLEI